MSKPANRINAPQRLKTAEVAIKTSQSLETALEILPFENYRPVTSIGSGLFRTSLAVLRGKQFLKITDLSEDGYFRFADILTPTESQSE